MSTIELARRLWSRGTARCVGDRAMADFGELESVAITFTAMKGA
jgi:hypothetical protein